MSKPEKIVSYLKQNPEFFEQHSDLLAELRLPGQNGTASLQQRQLEVMRDRERAYLKQIETFVGSARSNELLEQRMHDITLDLVAYTGTESDQQARTDFLMERLKHRLEIEYAAIRMAGFNGTEQAADQYADLVSRVGHQSSVCDDRMSSDLLQGLFASDAQQVGSCAFVPILRDQSVLGVLVLGAVDSQRFSPDLGAVYLDRLGQLVGAWYRAS